MTFHGASINPQDLCVLSTTSNSLRRLGHLSESRPKPLALGFCAILCPIYITPHVAPTLSFWLRLSARVCMYRSVIKECSMGLHFETCRSHALYNEVGNRRRIYTDKDVVHG